MLQNYFRMEKYGRKNVYKINRKLLDTHSKKEPADRYLPVLSSFHKNFVLLEILRIDALIFQRLKSIHHVLFIFRIGNTIPLVFGYEDFHSGFAFA